MCSSVSSVVKFIEILVSDDFAVLLRRGVGGLQSHDFNCQERQGNLAIVIFQGFALGALGVLAVHFVAIVLGELVIGP